MELHYCITNNSSGLGYQSLYTLFQYNVNTTHNIAKNVSRQ